MSFLGRIFGEVPAVSAVEARDLVSAGAVMVDVRTKGEWDAGHVRSAVHIALPDLAASLVKVPKNKQIVVACRSGNRSRGATTQLVAAGFDAVNLTGGLHAWTRAGQSLVNRQGKPGTVA